jgi:hypothetical protein
MSSLLTSFVDWVTSPWTQGFMAIHALGDAAEAYEDGDNAQAIWRLIVGLGLAAFCIAQVVA